MSSLTQLNTFSEQDIVYTANTVVIDRTVGNTFRHQPVTWDYVRTLGELTGTGVQITYTITTSGVTISFPDSAYSYNALDINTVGNVTTVGNIKHVLDYNAARALVNPGALTGNITYTVEHINTNDLSGNIIVDYVGVPV